MLLSTLGASLLGDTLTGKGKNRAGEGVNGAGYGNKRPKSDNKKTGLWKENGFLMPPHPLTNFEIQKYYQNEHKFKGVYSRNNVK